MIKFKAYNKKTKQSGDVVDITFSVDNDELEPTVMVDYENGERESSNSKYLVITKVKVDKGGLIYE